MTAFLLAQSDKGFAGSPQLEFSAESLTQVNGVAVKELVYVAPGMLRRELEVGHGHQIEITRWDKKISWLLMTEDKLYLERPLASTDERTPFAMSFEQTPIGQEPLNGVTTTKLRAVHRQADGTTLSGLVWTTKEGIMVKMDLRSDTTPPMTLQVDRTNVSVGKEDESLFEIPPSYRRLSLGGGSSP